MLVYDKYDANIHCYKIYPQLLEIPNLTELKLSTWCGVFPHDTLEIKLETVKKLEIKWNDGHTISLIQVSTYSNELYLKNNNLKIFPNLEHLIINLSYEHNSDGHSNTRIAQNIIEVIEFYPCKIKNITINIEKDPRWLFTGNLGPLKSFCSKNNIEHVIN